MKTNTTATGINEWHPQTRKYTAYALSMAVTCILKLPKQTVFKQREKKTSALGEWQLQIVWDLSVSDALAEVSTPTKSNGAN